MHKNVDETLKGNVQEGEGEAGIRDPSAGSLVVW